MDPTVLFGTEDAIRRAVHECLTKARRSKHILNLGHGVIQGTPESAVALFCELARQSAEVVEADRAEGLETAECR